MQYTFNKLDKDSLNKLYSVFGFRLKEIGSLIGISEDAVLKKVKLYGIPTIPRDKEKLAVDVLYTGMKKDRKKSLTDEELLRLCRIGYSDAAIGSMYNMTGEGIAYRRKKLGIPLSIKFNETKSNIANLKSTPKEVLESDYYNLTQEEFSEKYDISKVVWRPHLKSLDIKSKEINRIDSYPPFNREQRSLIIGGLLGDGSVSDGNRYYESHANKQRSYLLRKHQILKPYSSDIYPCDDNTGSRFSTVCHPNFMEFYNAFYEKGVEGKLIPVDFIKNNWSDDILAYWFFDDGYCNDEDYSITIANKCPYPEQARDMVSFLESVYHWGFNCYVGPDIYYISFSKEYYKNFIEILLKVATPDLYYKIPERFLTPVMINEIKIESIKDIFPKFYRKTEDNLKKRYMENTLFEEFKKMDFPYSSRTEDRKSYAFKTFKEHAGFSLKGSILTGTTSGLELCEAFFPNIYECKRRGNLSPVEMWRDDNFLRRLVLNRLNHADRLSNASIRTGVKLLSKAVTNFKPGIAKYFYKTYATNGRVFDYSCGFGSRMLAAMSLDMEYVGCEPNLKTYNNLNKFGVFLSSKTNGKFFISDKGSEEYIHKENYFDLAFSSPPFFDYEIYSQDSGQSIIKYPVYEDWLVGFWRKAIENCYKCLVPGGHFGVCISINQHEHMIEKTIEYCKELNFAQVVEYRAPYKQLFHSNEDKYDLIIIYKK